MTPDPERAQWNRIDENSRRLDAVNRELGGVQQNIKSVEDRIDGMEQGFNRIEGKLDEALKQQQQRSGAEALGAWIIKMAVSLSAAAAALWIWMKGNGS